MNELDLIEAHGRRVELEYGLAITSFFDPPVSSRPDAPLAVRRWRVVLPDWFPPGSWLSYPHAYESLGSALRALDETGVVDAVRDCWSANREGSAARNRAFSSIMAAHFAADRTYAELRRSRATAVAEQETTG